MFDISSGELGVIAVVALLVLGPEKLPGAARVAGAMLRRARNAYSQVRDQVERELAAEDLKQQVRAAQEHLRDVTAPIENAIRDTRSAVADIDAAAVAPVAVAADDAIIVDGADVGPPAAGTSETASAETTAAPSAGTADVAAAPAAEAPADAPAPAAAPAATPRVSPHD